MLLSTQTDTLGRRHGDEQAIRIIKNAGFDAYDFSLFRMFSEKGYWANQDDYLETAKKLRAVADECGITCNQSHAPFASSTGDPARDEEIFGAIVRAMEIVSVLGCDIMVVHPMAHLNHMTHAKELKELNMAFYRRLIPYCEKYGVRVACENLWQDNPFTKTITCSSCSRAEEFCDYLDTLNSPWIVGCVDIGHILLTDQDPGYFIRTMGHDRVKALHVHDNDMRSDSHTLPYTSKLNFDAITKALAEIHYDGVLTFEADYFPGKLPEAVEADAYRLMHSVGRYLISQIEKHWS